MNLQDFRKLLTSFADDPADVEIRSGRATFQIRDEVFDVQLSFTADENQSLLVTENEQSLSARKWLINRVARLPQLADRIIASFGATETDPFVKPAGIITPDLSQSGDHPIRADDAIESLLNFSEQKTPGATSVLYLTSDAGEGKTTVINRLAFAQAKKFKARISSTLVVPIPLSGRAFLTFDDAVIAALVNKLRFNYFYFDAFLALVQIGAIVPAFDGYEEMLVEGSKGEAVSALGGIVQSLDSSGTLIIAARKAFFDYLSFKSQARLLDAIGRHSASFSRLALLRWDRTQFLNYGTQRGLLNPEDIYQTVSDRLGPDHPLLTRAVLVRRLFDVMSSEADRKKLAELLGANPHDYFFTFVDAIINREATEKWLARVTSDLMEPLLTPEEHHALLASIALEMWQSSARSLKIDVLDVLMDIFSESRKKSGSATRQIRERIKQHSLLATDSSKPLAISFDHEDFQDFYLGEGLGRYLAAGSRADLYSTLSVNLLSKATVEQSIQYLIRIGADLGASCEQIKSINAGEAGFSFCKENCALLAIRIAEYLSNDQTAQHYSDMYFGADALLGRNLSNVTFDKCHFQPSSLSNSTLHLVNFSNSEFERLDLTGKEVAGCVFTNSRVDSLLLLNAEEYFFDPSQIDAELKKLGAVVTTSTVNSTSSNSLEADERLKLSNRFFRIFLRTTQVNEDVIRLRLGSAAAAKFFEEVLPPLIAGEVLSEVTWDGRGVQKRYRLSKPMSSISEALENSSNSFEQFLKKLED